MKKLIIAILVSFALLSIGSCGMPLYGTNNYWQKQGQKWNDHTNGKMKCKNNANPVKKFKS
jgi:hypothetical protein